MSWVRQGKAVVAHFAPAFALVHPQVKKLYYQSSYKSHTKKVLKQGRKTRGKNQQTENKHLHQQNVKNIITPIIKRRKNRGEEQHAKNNVKSLL